MISFLIQIPSETKIKMYLRRMLLAKICSVRCADQNKYIVPKIDIVAKMSWTIWPFIRDMAQEHEIISPHVVGSALVLDTKVPVQQTQNCAI